MIHPPRPGPYADSDRWRGLAWMTADTRGAVVFSGPKPWARVGTDFGRWNQVGLRMRPARPSGLPRSSRLPLRQPGLLGRRLPGPAAFLRPGRSGPGRPGSPETWSVEPYAYMDLSPYFFDPTYDEQDLIRYRRDFVGAITFDRDRAGSMSSSRSSRTTGGESSTSSRSARPWSRNNIGRQPNR